MTTGELVTDAVDTEGAVARRVQPIELVCLDMAGTTVSDDGLVEAAFEAALDAVGPDDPDQRKKMVTFTKETMGQSKIAVFCGLFHDHTIAQQANVAFEAAYEAAISIGGVHPIDGAEDAIRAIRSSGRRVALLTGFSPRTRDRLIKTLGWAAIADLVLCPVEAGRGRPAPDLVLTALMRLGVNDVAAVAVAGDTAADMTTGRSAGASILAGVLTGFDNAERLRAAGATDVLASVADLPELLITRTGG